MSIIMHLDNKNFNLIKDKKKTIEMRLNDSKRASLEIGDGGEGSLNAIINQIGGKKRYKRIFGPDFHKIWSSLGVKGDSCFIESADVVGFKYKKNDTSPSDYSTYGIGELIYIH